MRRSTPQHAQLSRLLHDTATPAGHIIQCSNPDCGVYYDPSDPAASYPHNNH